MKLFIVPKIYDTSILSNNQIENLVQKDIDSYVGKDKVIFKLSITGKTAAMYFYRGVDYSSLHADPKSQIIDADAYMVTGEGYEGFSLPIQFPKVPIICTYNMEQSEFIRAYMGSAELLRADKIKKAWLDIDEEKIVLRVNLK